MIRPFTCLCVLMAAGSGLYLYQTKHRSQMLDQDIVRVLKETQQARERTTILKAEYALLNQPERLQDLADKFLSLKPTQPQQFVQLADLDSRLPAPQVEHGAPMDEDDAGPEASAAAPLPQGPVQAPIQAPVQAPPPATPAASPPARLAPADHHIAATAVAAPVSAAVAPAHPAPEKPAASEKVAAEHPPVDRPAEHVAAETSAHETAARRAANPEVTRPALHAEPVRPVAAPLYQTVAPMPATRPALAYAPYGVPAMSSALGAYRTPLAPPVPVGGP